jgi:hypothetical protein
VYNTRTHSIDRVHGNVGRLFYGLVFLFAVH